MTTSLQQRVPVGWQNTSLDPRELDFQVRTTAGVARYELAWDEQRRAVQLCCSTWPDGAWRFGQWRFDGNTLTVTAGDEDSIAPADWEALVGLAVAFFYDDVV